MNMKTTKICHCENHELLKNLKRLEQDYKYNFEHGLFAKNTRCVPVNMLEFYIKECETRLDAIYKNEQELAEQGHTDIKDASSLIKILESTQEALLSLKNENIEAELIVIY